MRQVITSRNNGTAADALSRRPPMKPTRFLPFHRECRHKDDTDSVTILECRVLWLGEGRMTASPLDTQQLTHWMARIDAGDPAARDGLLRHATDRLERLARHMLRSHPAVQRWAQTDDVLQGALVRLARALESLRPASAREFFALAAQQLRRELIDLARHYYGAEGVG